MEALKCTPRSLSFCIREIGLVKFSRHTTGNISGHREQNSSQETRKTHNLSLGAAPKNMWLNIETKESRADGIVVVLKLCYLPESCACVLRGSLADSRFLFHWKYICSRRLSLAQIPVVWRPPGRCADWRRARTHWLNTSRIAGTLNTVLQCVSFSSLATRKFFTLYLGAINWKTQVTIEAMNQCLLYIGEIARSLRFQQRVSEYLISSVFCFVS